MKILIIILGLLLVSCSVNPSKITDAGNYANKITYVKDHKTGLCFAIVASRMTAQASQSGFGMACVPCSQVESHLEE